MTDITTWNQLAGEIHVLWEENERLKAEVSGLLEIQQDLEAALIGMIEQFSMHDGCFKHAFMGAEEEAYGVLGIKYGEKTKTVYERYQKKWNESKMKMEFCPMCGRRLNEKV